MRGSSGSSSAPKPERWVALACFHFWGARAGSCFRLGSFGQGTRWARPTGVGGRFFPGVSRASGAFFFFVEGVEGR